MYDHVYQLWIERGYAVELEEPEWQDREGNSLDTEAASFGSKVTHRLIHADRILVVDECGDNTNMKKDKKAGNAKFVTGKRDRALVSCASDVCHFTSMCFTNLLGVPVLVVIIIAKASVLSYSEQYGVNLSADRIGNDDHEDNTGPGKLFPGGPTCSLNGVEVPAFVTNSESGGMTSEILAACLKTMDDANVFPRSDGIPKPFVLLDGHGSRFEPLFLDYITDKTHRWEVCLGLPNGTHIWQVGDGKQQNGSFKRQLVKAKHDKVREKMHAHKEAKITKSDIVPLVNKAFPCSFGNMVGNRHAIADRGWNPLNRGCLEAPEVFSTKVASKAQATATTTENSGDEDSSSDNMPDSQDTTSSAYQASQTSDAILGGLNFEHGHSASIFNRIDQDKGRRKGQLESYKEIQENRKKREENGEAVDLMNKRVTAGRLVQMGKYSVNDMAPHLNAKIEKQTQAAEAAALAKKITEYRKDTVTFEKALDIRDTREESKWISDHYKVMIQFKRLRLLQEHVRTLELTNGSNGRNKKKKDKQPSRLKLPGIPSLLADRKAMWIQYQNYLDPDKPVPPEGYESDDENGSGVDGNNNAVGRFSSADESSVDGHNGGRFSTADESMVGVRYSSADESSVDGHNGGRFSSADKGSFGVRFSSANESSVDGHNGGRFSSADDSSDEMESDDDSSLLSDVANMNIF
jgi:hypothetical protein